MNKATTVEYILRDLHHDRMILERCISALSPSEIDWRIDARSTSIGDHVRHIAITEFCVVTAANDHSSVLDMDLWRQLKSGCDAAGAFSRVAGESASSHMDALHSVRKRTLELLPGLDEGRWLRTNRFRLKETIGEMARLNADEDAGAYQELLATLTKSLNPALDVECMDLVQYLAKHEAYHRGQTLFMQFLVRDVFPRKSAQSGSKESQ